MQKNKKDLASLKSYNRLTKILVAILNEKIADDLTTLLLIKGLKNKNDKFIKQAFKAKYGIVDNQLYQIARAMHQEKIKNINPPFAATGIIPPAVAKKMQPTDLLQNNPIKLNKIRQKNPELGKCYYNAQEIKAAFQWVINQYYKYYQKQTGKNLTKDLQYKIEIKTTYSSIDVRDKSSGGAIIGIPHTRIVGAAHLLNLLVHEIESHVRQSLNGILLFVIGGGRLKTDNEILYEGLAKRTEDVLNKKLFGRPTFIFHDYYIFAIQAAQKGKSFSQVFCEVRDKYLETARAKIKKLKIREREADKIAWGVAYRVFRGHIDTSNKEQYAMAKDKAYLQGWIIQKQLEAMGLTYLNEAGIFRPEDLSLLVQLDFNENDLPFPFLNITEKYVKQVMMPERFGYRWNGNRQKFIKK